MLQVWQDIRYSIRVLANSPVFSLVAIFSLALGIGANSAIFSLINALMIRPLPVREPQGLVALSTISPNGQEDGFSLPMLEEIERHQSVFSSMFGWWGGRMVNLEANGVAYAGAMNGVTGEYFSTLGITPQLGRTITPEDVGLKRGSPAKVVVLDYRCWQDRFRGDPEVVGKIIRIEGEPFTIIGVTRKEFVGLIIEIASDVTVPLTYQSSPEKLRKGRHLGLDVMARLKDSVTIGQARAQLAALWPRVQAATIPEDWKGEQQTEFLAQRLVVESGATGTSYWRKRYARQLMVLMSVVGLVLLIACVNLANLMLARAAGRRNEIAIRVALGASRWTLVRQFLTESLLLSLAGAALGLLAALWTSRILVNMIWMGFTGLALNPAPDLRVIGFTAAVATLTGVLFGIAPGWGASHIEPAGALQQSARTLSSGSSGIGKLLVSVQVALSLVLIIGAALFVRSLQKLRSLDPGFRREGVLIMYLFQKTGEPNIPNRAAYYQEVEEKLSQLPGVQSVSYSHMGPILAYEWKESVSSKSVPGVTVNAVTDVVGPGFLHTIGMYLLAGRDFQWHDDEQTPRVALISESLARRLFASGNALGERIRVGTTPEHQDVQIVGIVNSASLWSLRSAAPMAVYFSLIQESEYNQPLLDIRSAGDPAALGPMARRTVEALGYHYPLRIETLNQRLGRALMQERLVSILSSFFGALALLLAAIGLFGLMSYSVTRRTPEIGIRMALGAERGRVVRLILREVLWLLILGIALGLPIALAASRLISRMLFGLSPGDPATMLVSAAILLAVGLFAGYLPARRASRIDPMNALRCG